ncbi:MAG: mechanosensitive ion channel [Candidatus Latescibacterota bacterium]|jgi:small conductance mechanosensitive channel
MDAIVEQVIQVVAKYGLQVIGAILILIFGRMAAGIVRKLVRRALKKTGVDVTITGFVAQFAYIIVMVVAVLASLAKFGVQTTSFVAVLGAAGFAVGLALQGSLSHFAAGVMLLIFRPLKVGDFVEAGGVSGTVKEIRLFNTIMATPDNVHMVVPNSKIFNDIIRNFSVNDTRRIDLNIGIGYRDPIDRAMEVLMQTMRQDNRIIQEPSPQIVVTDLADSSVNLLVRCWTRRADFWAVKCDLNKNIKENFDLQGIEIPFPQRVVTVVNSGLS